MGDVNGDKGWPLNIGKPQEPERPTVRPKYVVPTIVEVNVKLPTKGKYKTKNGKALGCVVHYTAGRFDGGEKGAISTLRWLASQGLGCLVMDQDGVIYKAQGWDQYAYHAGASAWKGKTGMSQYCMGMEIMNAGLLEKKNGIYMAWFGQEIGAVHVREGAKKDNVKAGAYHKYTPAQEEALINFLLWQIDTQGMDVEFIVGHDEIAASRKADPGWSLSMTMPELRTLLKAKLKG